MAIKFSDITGGGIPFGNNASRPANPGIGKLYSNGEAQRLELYTDTGWNNIVQEVPGVASISGTYLESSNSNTITIYGTNFASGAVAYAIGSDAVQVPASSTTFNSLVQLTAVFGGLSPAYEPYDIKVQNPSNLFGLIPDALYINNNPAWQTAIGSLGTFNEQVSVSISATAIDESAVTYSLANGSALPSGITLNSSTGLISGTLPDISTDTTYSFTINASDGVNPPVSRTFSITSISQVIAEALVVAGGGGGGTNGNTTGGGGGGAGGYLYNNSLAFNRGTAYTLTIGAGGAGRARATMSHTTPESGFKGGNSSLSGSGIASMIAVGGGGGISNQSGGVVSDANGGSGGGGNYQNPFGSATPSGQGNNGGQTNTSLGFGNEAAFAGGGGGGSGSVGGNSTNSQGGTGGSGTANSITGTSLFYAAGGGGGARGGYTAGGGGSGIGGNGSTGTSNGGNAPVANRGSGGGGGGGSDNIPSTIGGTGSDGVIIIAYPDSRPALSVGSGLTYDQPSRAGYRVYRFTAGTGTITF